MLKTAFLKNFRIRELIQFITNIVMIVQQRDPEKLMIKNQYEGLNQSLDALEKSYKRDNASEITPQLAALDAQRDKAIVCLRQVSDGYTNYFDEAVSKAGSLIVSCIDKYGDKIYTLNYGAETAALKNLVRDLRTIPALTAAVTLIGMDQLVDHMDAANSEFERLFVQRLQELSEDVTQTQTELAQQTHDAYKALANHINAHAVLTPSADYTSLINHINENIDHYNQIVERRRKSGGAEEEEVGTDEPAATPTV